MWKILVFFMGKSLRGDKHGWGTITKHQGKGKLAVPKLQPVDPCPGGSQNNVLRTK